MLNTVHYIGRLVETPELRSTKVDSIPVTSFRIAVARDFVRQGEVDTDFFDAVAWRKTAEFICQHFEKGKLICLIGRNQVRKWEDKHEQKRESIELLVEKAYFVGDKNGGNKENSMDPFAGNASDDPFDDTASAAPPMSPFDD